MAKKKKAAAKKQTAIKESFEEIIKLAVSDKVVKANIAKKAKKS